MQELVQIRGKINGLSANKKSRTKFVAAVSDMRESVWVKNLFFLLLVFGGVSMLAFYLMAADRIAAPGSFSPKSRFQSDVMSVASRVDQAFENRWALQKIDHAEQASNLLVARRIALGLAGTIPSLEEIREFESQPTEHQIHWWVSRLLEDRRTSNHIAERLARALVGVENGPFLVFRRRRFVSWIADEVHANRRYDQLVCEILTNEGLWTDTPAVNFYTRTISDNEEEKHPDPILLAGRTSRAFLGMRIDCLQCHDDFLGTINVGSAAEPASGTQLDFHSLAAFFGEIENSLLGIRDEPSRGPYRYKLLDADREEIIPPMVPFNQDLDGHEGSLRERLAQWVTHPANKPFARATVNRMWAIMFGRGLVHPVDDIPLEGPLPDSLEILADDFVENQFDLHRLIRIIASTKVMQLKSHADFEVTRDHERALAVFPMVRLRPDQVAGGISQSTKLTTIDSNAHILTRLMKAGQQNEFVQRFGDPGEEEFADRGETVTQRLLMLNGKMVGDRLENVFSAPSHLGGLSPNRETAIDTVYLTTLTRRANQEEKIHAIKAIADKRGSRRTQEIIDLYWSLLNSAEFRWNH